jgi:hypothetical protein
MYTKNISSYFVTLLMLFPVYAFSDVQFPMKGITCFLKIQAFWAMEA